MNRITQAIIPQKKTHAGKGAEAMNYSYYGI